MLTNAATSDNAHWEELTGWGRTSPSLARVEHCLSGESLNSVLANVGPRGLLARGLGRSYGDAAQNAGGTVVVLGDGEIREPDPVSGVAVVTAGTSIAELIDRLLPKGWFVPVTPGTRFVSVGGAIAADVHGKNHHRDGSFGDWVEWVELARANGELLRVERGTPEFDATVGGMGLTGVITRAALRFRSVESRWISVDTQRAGDIDGLMATLEQQDSDFEYSVAWVDCLKRGAGLGRGVVTCGNHAPALDATTDPGDEACDAESPSTQSGLRVPLDAPPGLLNYATLSAFNEFWYRSAPRDRRGELQSTAQFFHPLDGIGAWNRIYGAGGFIQYQFAIPAASGSLIPKLLERLAAERVPSFLAVLKRFGPGRGLLSFPIEGWTLAMDFPTRYGKLAELTKVLNREVIDAGGRTYLAKDSVLQPEEFRAMYPEFERWLQIRDELDPERKLISDLARRLQLYGLQEC